MNERYVHRNESYNIEICHPLLSHMFSVPNTLKYNKVLKISMCPKLYLYIEKEMVLHSQYKYVT